MFFKVASIFALTLLSGALADQVLYDPVYDNSAQSTNTVACSNLTPNFPTFDSFPTFPNIGSASAISGFGSAECGSCWQLTDTTTGVQIFFTAIDHAGNGFVVSETAMNTLTDGQAVALGVIQATAVQVDASNCGI